MKKRIIATCVAAVLCLGAASAAQNYKQSITVEYGIGLEINGQKAVLKDPNGKIVDPFVYNGTTYVPIRAVSENFGANVGFDAQSNTASVNIAWSLNDAYWMDIIFRINDFSHRAYQLAEQMDVYAANVDTSDELYSSTLSLVQTLSSYANVQIEGYLSYFEEGTEDYNNAKILVDQCKSISNDIQEMSMYFTNFVQIPTQYSAEALTSVHQKILTKIETVQGILLQTMNAYENEYLK